MKKFIADPSFWELFPNAAIGVLSVSGIDEAAQLPPEQKELARRFLCLSYYRAHQLER